MSLLLRMYVDHAPVKAVIHLVHRPQAVKYDPDIDQDPVFVPLAQELRS